MGQLRKCKECGLEFTATNGMQKYCDRDHFRACKICGKQIFVPKDKLSAKDFRVTCSRECSAKLRAETNIEKYGGVAPACSAEIQKKIEDTTFKRYGVQHAAQSKEIKAKTAELFQRRYGAASPLLNTDIQTKSKLTSLDKYGTTSPSQNAEVRKKISSSVKENAAAREQSRKTYCKRTGYCSPFSNPEVKQKSADTMRERYGVEHPMQSADIQERAATTNLNKYGVVNPAQSAEVQDRIQSTNLEKYGSRCYLQSAEGKAATREAMLALYSKQHYSQTSEFAKERMLDPSKVSELLAFRTDPRAYIQSNFTTKPSLTELGAALGISPTTAGVYIHNSQCEDLVAFVHSQMEREVLSELKQLVPNAQIEVDTRKIITPYEIDLYLPEYNLGIECNPTCTHNSTINTFERGKSPTHPLYHKMKSDLCTAQGIFLFHIFGYDWTHNKGVIVSMLRNLVHANTQTIGARKLRVEPIRAKQAREFFDTNHRQGYSAASVKLGLISDEGELISCMTFGKPRMTIGSKYTQCDSWELVRFANKAGVSVPGGASKLLKKFIKDYRPELIYSFSDVAHTRGNLYKTLGFAETRRSEASYVWVDTNTDVAYHRMNAQKRNMKQFLHDDNIDLTKSEKQIMEDHGFVQVYDSGTITWERTFN